MVIVRSPLVYSCNLNHVYLPGMPILLSYKDILVGRLRDKVKEEGKTPYELGKQRNKNRNNIPYVGITSSSRLALNVSS